MTNSRLSDDEFLAGFEAATLADFRHADHIRAAWIYMRRLPFPQLSRRMAESLRYYAAQHGVQQKYHETITQAWMLLVWDALGHDLQAAGGERTPASEAAIDASPGGSHENPATSGFEVFADTHPELLDVHALDRFYSRALLASHSARNRSWILRYRQRCAICTSHQRGCEANASEKRFPSQNRRCYSANIGCNGN